MFISYSQNFEDVLLNRIFKDQEKGFYIDIGAHHPIYDSVTKAFSEKGWTGINIEPVSHFFQLLKNDRPNDINLNIAISDQKGELNFYELLDTGLSTFDRDMAEKLAEKNGFSLHEYPVAIKTLADICHQYVNQPIDFLKIDVEGWEEKVILGHDWQNFRPKIILLEATIPNSPIRKETNISDFLASHNYQHIFFDGLNDFYLAEEVSNLRNFFSTPVNVFDEFIRFSEYDQKHHISNLEKTIHIKDSEKEDLNFQINHLEKTIHIKDNEKEDLNFQINHLEKILVEQQKNIEKHNQETANIQNYLRYLEVELDKEKELIKAMESSKFWKLRKKWFNLKEKIGLPTD